MKKETLYKIIGALLLLIIISWMAYITIKINKLNKFSNNLEVKTQNTSKALEKIEKVNTTTENKQTTSKIDNDTSKTSTNKQTTKKTTTSTKTTTTTATNNTTKSVEANNNTSKLSNADNDILAYFNEAKTKLENANLRDEAKEDFITIVDFLFYNGTIKGYTFNELSNKTKLQVLKIALTIDSYIDKYFPNYKDTISSNSSKIYTNVKEEIIEKYLEITTTICTNNPSTCEQAKSDFQDMKKSFSITWDVIKNLADSGVANLKQWYEIYSGK